MGTRVTSERDAPEPIIRRKTLTAHNAGGMRTEIDVGEYGRIVTDEPVVHGGTGEGPSPRTAASTSRPSSGSTSGAGSGIVTCGRTSRRSASRLASTPTPRRISFVPS